MSGPPPFDMRSLMEALSGGGGAGMPGMPGMTGMPGMPGMPGGFPGMPDMAALQQEMMQNPEMQRQMQEMMQNDPTIKAFQQIAEELEKDPEFIEMTQALREQAASGGAQDMRGFQDMMAKVFSNEKYMRKAEQMGKAILESSPELKNVMSTFQAQAENPAVAAQVEQEMKALKANPEFKGFTDLMEAGKVPEAMAFLQSKPELMAKYNAALGKVFEGIVPGTAQGQGGARALAGAAVPEEEEELVDLHTAASEGEPQMVKELLAAGAGVDEQDEEGRTPLHFACGYGELECARLLLEAGARVDAVDHNANTALHYAAGYGNVEAVQLLLQHKASVTAKNQDGNTPLQVASLNEHADVIAVLEKAQPPKGLGAGLAPRKK